MTYPHPNSKNPNYFDTYKQYNYWHMRYHFGPNNTQNGQYLFWYYNYYYPYAARGIQTTGYLANPAGMYMGHPPNNYMQMKKH